MNHSENLANPQKIKLSSTLKSNYPVEIVRIFSCPVERIWMAWTDSAMLKQWWGPSSFTCPVARIHFTVGGNYLFAMQDHEGVATWSTGTYEEIIPLKKIVCTDQFADDDGNILTPEEAGMPNVWPKKFLGRMTIEFCGINDEETRMNLKYEGLPKQVHHECVQGWNTSFDKLQKLVERN